MNALASIMEKGADSVRTLIQAPCGSTAELRAFLGETMALAAVHAELAGTYATLLSPPGHGGGKGRAIP